MRELVNKEYNLPDGCIEIYDGVIKRAELGLGDSLAHQGEILEKRLKIQKAMKLQKYEELLDSKLDLFKSVFVQRITSAIDDIIATNDKKIHKIENICSEICLEVLLKIGAEMNSQEKVRILVKDALKNIGTIDNCTILVPAGLDSIRDLLPANSEHWTIKEDEAIHDDEIIIEVSFGKIDGRFNKSFRDLTMDIMTISDS